MNLPKPTRLWNLTGKKHFRRMIMDRECTRPSHRDKPAFFQLVGVVFVSALAVLASFGGFMPPNRLTAIKKCDTSKSKKTCKPPKEPCPPQAEKPMRSCNKDD